MREIMTIFSLTKRVTLHLCVVSGMLVCIPGSIPAAESQKCDYREYQRLPLTKTHHGINGALVVMRDKSVLEMDHYNPPDFETTCNARVNLVGHDTRKLKTIKLEQPVAKIDTVKLVGGKPDSFSLQVDYSAGWGSYSGPITFFFDVVEGKITWIHAKDAKTGKTAKIAVMKSLKSHWELSPHKQNQDILELACRPTYNKEEENPFELTYIRYRWSDGGWIRYSRSENGYLDFEADTEFPKSSLFPPLNKTR